MPTRTNFGPRHLPLGQVLRQFSMVWGDIPKSWDAPRVETAKGCSFFTSDSGIKITGPLASHYGEASHEDQAGKLFFSTSSRTMIFPATEA